MECKIPEELQTVKFSDTEKNNGAGKSDDQKWATGLKTENTVKTTNPERLLVDEEHKNAPKLVYRAQVLNGERKLVFVHPKTPVLKEKITHTEAPQETTLGNTPVVPKPESSTSSVDTLSNVELMSTVTQTVGDTSEKTTKLVFSIKRDSKGSTTEKETPKATLLPGTDMEYRTPGAHYLNKNGQVKRPMNAFMVWAREYRGYLAASMPNATNSEISVRLGQEWSKLKPEEKQYFYKIAERIKRKHRSDFPDWVYKPAGRKTDGSQDQFIIPSTDKVPTVNTIQRDTQPVPPISDGSLNARPIQPAPLVHVTPETVKPPPATVSSTRIIPLPAFATPAINPVVTSTPLRGLYPRTYLTQPLAPTVTKTINIQLGSNGIQQSALSPTISETTKNLLSNKLGRSAVNLPVGNGKHLLLELTNTVPGTQAMDNVVIATQPITAAVPTSPLVQALPVSIRLAADPTGIGVGVDNNSGQMQTPSLSRLLTEPLGQNALTNLYRRPDLARQKKYTPAFVPSESVITTNTQTGTNTLGQDSNISVLQGSVPSQPSVNQRNTHTRDILPPEDLLQTQLSNLPLINEENSVPTCGVGEGKRTEEVEAEKTDTSSGDDLWPFPFPEEPSDSWSEGDGRRPMYEELLESFSSSFDDSDYLYSEIFPGCLKLDVESWRRYLEDEDDIGSLIDPEACFRPHHSSDINISPIPLAKTLGKPFNNTDIVNTDHDPLETHPVTELSKVYAEQSFDSSFVNDAEVLESISYFSELTSKVNDVMRQGDGPLLEETSNDCEVSRPNVVLMSDNKTLKEYLNRENKPAAGEPHTCEAKTSKTEENANGNTEIVCDTVKPIDTRISDAEPTRKAQNTCLRFNLHNRLDEAKFPDKAVTSMLKNTPVTQDVHEDIEGWKELSNKITGSRQKDLEKGDQVGGCTIYFENEIMKSRSTSEAGSVRQTRSLTKFDKVIGNVDNSSVSSPCKRQRSATCLIENETARRKL